jgi:DNA-nicking Smr family endonuclease
MGRASDLKKKTSTWSYTPFEGLRDASTGKLPHAEKGSPSACSKPAPGVSDEEVFLDAMADVREIREFREIPPRKPARRAPPSPGPDDTMEALREIVEGRRRIPLPDTSEYAEWVNPRLRRDIARRLHEGDFAVQDYIDLHGMGLGEAEEAFREFFREAVRKNLFCIKVIHGRGLRSPKGPILKEALRRWLHGPYRKWVSAYATARDCDGGLGATYIMLKGR